MGNYGPGNESTGAAVSRVGMALSSCSPIQPLREVKKGEKWASRKN